jgi:hypothetical protein
MEPEVRSGGASPAVFESIDASAADVRTGCCSCGTAGRPKTPVYAIGNVRPRFPSVAVEKELAQAASRDDLTGLTDQAAIYKILSQRQNRYLARAVCWVFSIEGIDTYILVPRNPDDIEVLIEAARTRTRATDVDVVIGELGPLAPPSMCNGLAVPIVMVNQLYSFDVDTLLRAIPAPEGANQEAFLSSAEEMLGRIMLATDNAGASDEHRALNYLAVRYQAIYHTTANQHAKNRSLASVETRLSPLTGTRTIVDVILTYRDRATDAEESFLTRVDVTETFPFLVTKLSPYFRQGF